MASDRISLRIEKLLDEADLAVTADQWPLVASKARAVLAIDAANADAQAYLAMAIANGVDAPNPAPAPAPASVRSEPVEPPPAAQPPASFVNGRYHVRRFLGEGGKKRVFLAHDQSLDRDVAFALIKTEGLDATGRERIVREAQAMGRLGAHPHVVTIFEIGEEGGAPYVVTELMGGGDVEGAIEKAAEHRLPLERSLRIASEVARGLVFAHAQGIVHRDLKPGNVWLTADGVAKIGDFGLAVALDRSRLTQHGMMVGTVAYMPPEQALGGEVTPQSDLYSLGAMLYELVTGKPPFQADDPTAIISQHINTPPVAPSWNSPHCPPDLEALILRLLAKAPQDRPASAQEVLDALARVDPEARSASHSDSQANPLDRLARGVFVGREQELARLRTAFDNAFAGRGSVVMLVGEPGIGKTRTVQELETYARMRGAKVFWGRAHEASGAPAYWPWMQVGRAYREQTAEETRRKQGEPYAVELQRIFPRLRELFPNLPEPPPADSEEAQFALFDAWSSFIRSVAAEQPLVVVLDDVHWADRPTLRMLTHLSRDIDRARLLVLGTYRDTDLDRTHPLSEALAEMNREQLFSRILLRGLTEDETAAYIRGTANVQTSSELVHRIHVETEGNPFFLSEVVNLMAEEGTLSSQSLSDVRIPQGVREALGRRLDRLSSEANELLSIAAVIGREFSHTLLLALSSLDEDGLLALVEEALKARVIEETSTAGEYRFTHALMQDALYAELSTARRVRMHGRVAETLEALFGGNLDGRAAELARHFGEAVVMDRSFAERAVRYAEVAAHQAEAAAAWDEAARWYEQAIAELDGVGASAREGDLLVSMALCMRYAGRGEEFFFAVQRAAEAYSKGASAQAFADGIVRALTGLTLGTDLIVYRDIMESALKALEGAPSETACHLLALLAFGSLGEAESLGDTYAAQARAMASSLRLPDGNWRWILDRREQGLLSHEHGDLERSMELGERLFPRLAAGTGSQLALATSVLGEIALVAYCFGQIDRAKDAAERLLRFCDERHLPGLRRPAVAFELEIALGRNDRATVEAFREEGLRYMRASRILVHDAVNRGDSTEIAELLPLLARPGAEATFTVSLGSRVRALLAIGRVDEARRVFDEWKQSPRWRHSPTSSMISSHAVIGEQLLDLGDDALLHRAYEIMERLPQHRLSGGAGEATDVMRGAVSLHFGQVDAAEHHYSEGLEWSRRPDVRFGLVEGRCLQGLAAVAEARGDTALAMQHLDAAGEKFAEYGAKLYLEQVLAKKQFLKA